MLGILPIILSSILQCLAYYSKLIYFKQDTLILEIQVMLTARHKQDTILLLYLLLLQYIYKFFFFFGPFLFHVICP